MAATVERELAARMIALIAALATSAVACDRKRSDEPLPFADKPLPTGGFNQPRQGRAFAVGERAEVPELAVTVEGTKPCRAEHLREGSVLLGVELSVEGRSATELHFNPFHCKLRDARGSSFTPTFKGCEPRLRDYRLGKEEWRRGWVSFGLPGPAEDLKLVCSQTVAGEQMRVLQFDLSGK